MSIRKDNIIENLLKASIKRRLNPFDDLPWNKAPDMDSFWISPELITIYGQPEYDKLSIEQQKRLSQLEFCLLCSVSASGEKEVVANMVRRMFKSRYSAFRKYFHFFIEEENNHMRMFADFCEKYGKFYPILYSYAQGDMWEYAETEDLLTFIHVLIFEELGQGINETLMNDDRLPELVRAINAYHVADEGRHISFGRLLVREHVEFVKQLVGSFEWKKLQDHVLNYLKTRHIDYHNIKIYQEIGIKEAFLLREKLISYSNESFFAKSPKSIKRVNSLINFLGEMDLLPAK
ncbi:diiron oxygenase [Neisseria sp.]|uniref:diiron oxygenase n=1 Tax=Neisseria sp. TaxID=192066 RepID=UPI0026DB773A|nr:diiron oxygenase [Neisseria sp.]MDO4907123.1 diiron oxygenase [Neisseria sp.]